MERGNGARGFTLTELLVVIAILGILSGLLLSALSWAVEGARRVGCASNLRQMGLVFAMHSGEAKGFYPSIQPFVGDNCDVKNTYVLMVDGLCVYPDYLTDARVLICPSNRGAVDAFEEGWWSRPDGSIDPCLFDAMSYFYAGWVLDDSLVTDPDTDDASVAFALSFATLLACEAPECAGRLKKAWSYIDDLGEEHTVMRLRDGVERFLITDINNPSLATLSSGGIAVMFDRVDEDVREFNHVPGGGNVLYMDGHVEFQEYPGKFPVSRAWAQVVDWMDL